MIENISYTAENGVLIEADVNGLHKKILFSDIEPYWEYSDEDEFESGCVEPFGDFIIFTILTANGQGGIIVIWDMENDCVLHISEAAYCVAFSVYNGYVYTLCGISSFVTPFHYELYAAPIFIKDAWKKGGRLYCPHPCKTEESNIYTKYELKVDNDGIQVIVNDICYNYSDTSDITALSSYNEEYSFLYNVSANESEEKKKVFLWLT